MPSHSCFGFLAVFHETMPVNRTLGGLLERNSCQQPLCHCRMEWSFNSETVELNTGGFCCNGNQRLEHSTSTDMEKQPMEKDLSTSIFVNHAAIAWHESRKKWVGDQSRRSKRKAKDPIISWSMGYEDLLSTNEPFSEPIPLPEMVDFLVDIWHDEGLYD